MGAEESPRLAAPLLSYRMVSPSPSIVQVTDKEVELDRTSATRSGEQATRPSVLPQMSGVRRAFLLAIFCFALFVDAFMTSGMIICLDGVSVLANAYTCMNTDSST